MVKASLVAQWQSPPANAGEQQVQSLSGEDPGEGNGNPLQYSCLGKNTEEEYGDRGAQQATVHGVSKESDMTQRLNNNQDC